MSMSGTRTHRSSEDVKLDGAALCRDCREVFDARGRTTCPGCAGQTWDLLARFLDRPQASG